MKSVREFAIEVVRTLRDAEHESLWAGGCVRDQLLGREPKDYDVATSATPQQVRALFGHNRTLAIGEAFGVIAVLGPNNAYQIEVATFRQDADYSDGRRPDAVTFCDAEQDAQRRDFTINGLFFDPLDEHVVDYVGGELDLVSKTIRAIGKPEDRFAEDRLRILRAVRFATELDFQIDTATLAAIVADPQAVMTVSAERITAEMRRLLVAPHRTRGVRLLIETGLLAAILPECQWSGPDDVSTPDFTGVQATLENLSRPSFSAAVASLLRPRTTGSANARQWVASVCRRWKMSGIELRLTSAMLEYEPVIRKAEQLAWSRMQPILIRPDAIQLVEFAAAVSRAESEVGLASVEFCRQQLQRPMNELDPAPLLTGDDLKARGIAPGSIYKTILSRVRAAQLDGEISTVEETIDLCDSILAQQGE